MTVDDGTSECFVCRKHCDRGPLTPGGPVAEDELVLVSHIITPDALGRREYWGIRVNEWPDAGRGTAADIAELVARLREFLAAEQLTS